MNEVKKTIAQSGASSSTEMRIMEFAMAPSAPLLDVASTPLCFFGTKIYQRISQGKSEKADVSRSRKAEQCKPPLKPSGKKIWSVGQG